MLLSLPSRLPTASTLSNRSTLSRKKQRSNASRTGPLQKASHLLKSQLKRRTDRLFEYTLTASTTKKPQRTVVNSKKKKNKSESRPTRRQITASSPLLSSSIRSLDARRSRARTLSTTMLQILTPSNSTNTE